MQVSQVPPPQSRKCACHLLREAECVKSNWVSLESSGWQQRRWSCRVFKGICYTLSLPTNMAQLWDIRASAVALFSNEITHLRNFWPFFKREFPHVLMTHYSCSNFKYDVTDVNTQIRIDFKGENAILVNMINHIVKTFHYNFTQL